MAKKTIPEVICDVLREAGRPMSAREIYDSISSRGLYEFKAKDPANIVRSQLRRHCIDVKRPAGARTKYFKMAADGNFDLLEQPRGDES